MKRKKDNQGVPFGTSDDSKLVTDEIDYQHAKITIGVENFDYLIGLIFTHVELLGLPDRQLSAYKSSLRKLGWEWYNRFVDNPHGFSDPSHQARVSAGVEPAGTSTLSGTTYVTYVAPTQ